MEKKVTEQLEALGYSQAWLDFGFLSLDKLEQQYYEVNNSDDDNPEHYRYAVLVSLLDKELSDEDLCKLLKLIESDPDPSMAGSFAALLLRKAGSTDTRFKQIASVLSKFGKWTEKVINMEIQKRK
ncbi:hypothetical protein D0T84_03135 [Dysgonomonas sp. 521]|uniref:hypothetical protein n=1 Tax=Dysgonomonas sp. 521 TaxID=2302932 RepID=UPI0013D5D3BF|nr:hypothetical protein [Dysgonomonas sp. 521]NDV93913.1 hypothetical protein [Dysgonomonas sp. 521]